MRANWKAHTRGKDHISSADQKGIHSSRPPTIPAEVDGHTKCKVCNLFMQSNQMDGHERGSAHRAQARAREEVVKVKAYLREAGRDKIDVTVSHSDGLDMRALATTPAKPVHGIFIVKRTGGNARLIYAKIRKPRTAPAAM
jgi:hypothetical protein